MSPTRKASMLAVSLLGRSNAITCPGVAAWPAGLACARACATAASGEATQASTSGQEAAPGWLGREIKAGKEKGPPLGWMYMREGPDGTKKFMPLTERLIWGAVLGGIGYFSVPRIYNARKRAAEEKVASAKREEALHARRLTAIRVLLSNKDWLHDEADAFEGMTPKQIVEFIKKHSIDPEDPFEGMSPEEIDEFVKKTGLSV